MDRDRGIDQVRDELSDGEHGEVHRGSNARRVARI
jgi:hypothetical protein